MPKSTPCPDRPSISPDEKMRRLVEIVYDAKASDIVSLHVAGQTPLADYFVLCTANSSTHVAAVADRLQMEGRDALGYKVHPEGSPDSNWVLMDYGDTIVHIFTEETREFYALERLWADAERVEHGDAL